MRSVSAITAALMLLAVSVRAEAVTPAAPGKRKNTWTYPMPAKQKPADPMAQAPGAHIPEHPERFVWKTAPRPKVKDQKGVPVYQVGGDGRLSKIGMMAFGTTVTLDTVRVVRREQYYGVPWGDTEPKQTAWISGAYVTPAAFAAPGQ